MKLIDLLVKELPWRGGWPEGAACVVQDNDGQVCFSSIFEGLTLNRDKTDWLDGGWAGNWSNEFYDVIADDRTTAIVTREQYEAALAAKNDGWIEWGGGECPLERGAIVDVKHRDGGIFLNAKALVGKAESCNQGETEHPGDIIAYRMHRPDINSHANDDRLEQDLNECIGASEAQEWSGDGAPPIGCACEMQDSKGAWLPVDIIAKNDGFTFGWSYDYRIVLFGDKADEFRPLRTEAEKAREKLAASLHVAAGASPIELNGIGPLYFKLADSIISGSVFGTTFKADK